MDNQIKYLYLKCSNCEKVQFLSVEKLYSKDKIRSLNNNNNNNNND